MVVIVVNVNNVGLKQNYLHRFEMVYPENPVYPVRILLLIKFGDTINLCPA